MRRCTVAIVVIIGISLAYSGPVVKRSAGKQGDEMGSDMVDLMPANMMEMGSDMDDLMPANKTEMGSNMADWMENIKSSMLNMLNPIINWGKKWYKKLKVEPDGYTDDHVMYQMVNGIKLKVETRIKKTTLNGTMHIAYKKTVDRADGKKYNGAQHVEADIIGNPGDLNNMTDLMNPMVELNQIE